MSLRAFHYFFIFASTLLSVTVAAWGVTEYRATGEVFPLLLGVGSVGAAAALVAYSQWVRKKLSRIPCVLVLLMLAGHDALSCPSCNVDPNSPLIKGAGAGVLLLVGVVSTVLAAIAFIGFTWARRARALGSPALAESVAAGSRPPAALGEVTA